MGTRIVCPQCGDKLKLDKPVIDSTRVKCRQCGNKFYAGKAENWGGTDQPLAGGFHPLPRPSAPVNDDEHLASLEAEGNGVAVAHGPEDREQKKRRRQRHHETKLPRWAMPVGIVALAAVALAGIFLGQQPPPPPEPHSADESPRPKAKTPKPEPVEDTFAKSKNNYRPPELVGVWQTNNPPGAYLDLAANGSIHVHGAFLDQNTIDSTSRWYTMRIYGDVYELEIGPEPKLASNHGARLIMRPDGTLVMTRYASSAAMSLQERVFTKAQ